MYRPRSLLFVAGILAIALLWPHSTPQRPLGPRDLGAELASGLVPAAPVSATGEPAFRLAIGADERLWGRRLDVGALKKKLRRPLRERAERQPKLLPADIALPFATGGRVLDCQLTLQIGDQRSAPLACAEISDFA